MKQIRDAFMEWLDWQIKEAENPDWSMTLGVQHPTVLRHAVLLEVRNRLLETIAIELTKTVQDNSDKL